MTQKPSRSDIHVNQPLTQISIAFMQNQSNFIAHRAFPLVQVSKQSDRYYTFDRGYFNRDEMKVRAPGTESSGTSFAVDNTPTYFCDVWAIHEDIPDMIRANQDSPVGLDSRAAELLSYKGLLRKEIHWASKYFIPGVWTNDLDGVAASPGAGEVLQWDNASSNPIENVRTGKRTMLELTGFMPNKMVMGRAVYDALVDHPDIVGRMDRGQTSGPARANVDALAALFELDEILVMDAIQNTAKEGAANSHSFIGGKRALLAYAPPSAGLMTPSAGYTFAWTGYTGAGAFGGRVKSFYMDAIESERIELDLAFDMKLVSADLGYFWDSIVS